jgi:hypothetical protein
MSSTTEHQFRDLAGLTFGSIEVRHIHRRSPLAWAASCNVCGSQFVLSHVMAQQGQCPRGPIACRRVEPTQTEHRTFTRVIAAPPARQQPAPVAPQPVFSANADPAGMRGYLDSLERQQKERG